MFSKQEMAILKQQFWTSFGQYMTPVPSAEGFKINWVNYKTGVKDLHFKMLAGNTAATISIVMAHAITSRQTLFFNQFMRVKNLLQDALQEDWQWALHMQDENNKTVSCIYTSFSGVNIFKKEDWPAVISFFKPRMIALDSFWNEVKFGFEDL
jgi:hypothetical protein